MTGYQVLAVGEVLAAFRSTGPIRLGAPMRLSVAGAEANVAIGLARLGHACAFAGRIGGDEFGALALRTLRGENVDTTYLHVDQDRPTGLLVRETRIGTLTRVGYYRAGSAGSAVEPADVVPAVHGGLRVLHLTGITPALGATGRATVRAVIEPARQAGALISFDLNYRARLWGPAAARAELRALAREAGVLFASADELHLVADDGAEESAVVAGLLAAGVGEVVITRGGAGATVATGQGTWHRPARTVPVVDVVGAGDAFVAGYLSGVLDGLDITQRLERALTTAAFAVTTDGDWEGTPTRADLTLFDADPDTTIR